MPSGAPHIVLRLGGAPVRILTGLNEMRGLAIARAVVGGPRAGAYAKLVGEDGPSVGVVLRPGAAQIVLGLPGRLLAEQHVPLADIWPAPEVATLHDRLAAERDASARLDLLEAYLEARIAPAPASDRLVGHVRAGLDAGMNVATIVAETGFSHRHVTSAFAESVGLAPKLYQRLRRFNDALDALHRAPAAPLADLAAALGYADQAHFTREFRAFAHIGPGDYRRAAPLDARHVPA